ncbi:hypothetical protein ACH5RR_015369 [Cinchona calisaya]|uniref:DUF4283 domain-containing protein n=1 Tax=Cinchona calisaya TaxID=153742 RepID=A0ABD2ZW44_9GENT
MAEAFAELCTRLKITKEKASVLVDNDMITEKGPQRGDLCLLAKVNVHSSLVGEKTALFQFKKAEDRMRVLYGAPWAFDRNSVVLSELNGDTQPSALEFHWCEFWVQVFDFPYNRKTKIIAKLRGNKLANFVFVEVDENELCWGEFMRVRVASDIRHGERDCPSKISTSSVVNSNPQDTHSASQGETGGDLEVDKDMGNYSNLENNKGLVNSFAWVQDVQIKKDPNAGKGRVQNGAEKTIEAVSKAIPSKSKWVRRQRLTLLYYQEQSHSSLEGKSHGKRFIGAWVELIGSFVKWQLTCVYGELLTTHRCLMGGFRKLKLSSANPWGSWYENDSNIEGIVVDHFSQIFTSSYPSNEVMDVVMERVRRKVSDEANNRLIQPYTTQEGSNAILRMDSFTSSSPEGFSPVFYQKLWPIVGQLVNLEKSTIVFSKSTNSEARDSISACLNIPEVQAHQKYLGLPSMQQRRRRQCFGCFSNSSSGGVVGVLAAAAVAAGDMVWALSFLHGQVMALAQEDGILWICDLLLKLKGEDKNKAALVIWALWGNRNSKAFEGSSKDPLPFTSFVSQYLLDFSSARTVPNRRSSSVDGNGSFVAGVASRIDNIAFAEHAEMMETHMVVQLGVEL